MYLKDYHRKQLLQGDKEEEPTNRITTYEEEQQALKSAFHIPSDNEDEEDLIQPKTKSKETKSSEEQEYQKFLKTALQDETSKKMLNQLETLASQSTQTGIETEDSEAFLAKYLLNRGWLDPSGETPELYEDPSSDEEKAETFENEYNFRFEQPGGTDLVTHARTLSSARRGDEKRKKERERKKGKKEEEKKRELEEIARLRNLKRKELEDKILKIEGVAGAGGWTEKDLEADFDPEDWDKRMQGVFDETYYNDVILLLILADL
jgi:protein KRI1